MFFFMFSCKKDNPFFVDVSHIKVDLSIKRFDKDFYETSSENLADLKKAYPNFFPINTPDSVWIQKQKDKDELELYLETQNVFGSLKELENDLTSLFKHIIYYFPEFKTPKVTTVLSNIDYEYRVIYNQENLVISLDCYLGKNHQFYGDYPDYIKENNTKEFIVVDVANKIIDYIIPFNTDRTLLGKMVYEGKKQYLLDLFLPIKSEKLKSTYTKEKLDWAKANEEFVWRYFIDKNYLYSTDTDLSNRFIDLAPFSKFYMQEDIKSPGKIGVWIGKQIVHSFMKKNDVSLQTLLKMGSQELLQKSKYKPRS